MTTYGQANPCPGGDCYNLQLFPAFYCENENPAVVCNAGLKSRRAFDDTTDEDGDGLIFRFDNCPNTLNPDQSDMDADGYGDACDDWPYDPTRPSQY